MRRRRPNVRRAKRQSAQPRAQFRRRARQKTKIPPPHRNSSLPNLCQLRADKSRDCFLGSARASRAGCGALAATNFYIIMASERNRDRESAIASTRGRKRSPETNWLNRFVWFTAFTTLLLICSGGMVTSKGVGLAVPDWPTTFGYNMFLFPVSKWIGGVLFEHIHRLIASTVGFLTIILAIWLWRVEDRPSVRTLGLFAVAGVILQGILGGLRVTILKDELGIFHACLAQAVRGLLVVIALVTSKLWRALSDAAVDPKKFASIKMIAIVATVSIYTQLALGAT